MPFPEIAQSMILLPKLRYDSVPDASREFVVDGAAPRALDLHCMGDPRSGANKNTHKDATGFGRVRGRRCVEQGLCGRFTDPHSPSGLAAQHQDGTRPTTSKGASSSAR